VAKKERYSKGAQEWGGPQKEGNNRGVGECPKLVPPQCPEILDISAKGKNYNFKKRSDQVFRKGTCQKNAVTGSTR